MRDLLEKIPTSAFEFLGVFAGGFACVITAIQIYEEYMKTEPSTMGGVYLYGWVLVFGIWVIYGFRFRCLAVWSTNLIAFILQIIMIIIIHCKAGQLPLN